MSFSAPSNISQNDAEVLKKQRQEMQWRHKEEQWLLAQLEKAVKLCRAEHTAQKARKEAEEKAWEEAERQRVVEEEERKRRTMSRSLKMDLIFISPFFFSFSSSIYFLFLEPGLGRSDKDHTVTGRVTSDDMVTSHMTQRRT